MTSKTFAAQRRFLSQMVVQEEREEPKDSDVVRMANASGRQGGAADNVMDVVEQQQRFRPLVIQSNPFKGCTGSATVEMGKTRVSCTVIGPREHQASETVLEGVLNISLQGSIDLALRYSIEHALQAVVCLKKLARTEVNVELNVLADDGGALAACMLAAGVAIGSANIEIFDLVLACNLLILSQPSDSETPQFILDPDQATICAHMDRAATLTMAIVPSIGQVILTELGGFPLPHRLVRRAMPLAFNHCASLFPSVRDALLQNVDDESGPTI